MVDAAYLGRLFERIAHKAEAELATAHNAAAREAVAHGALHSGSHMMQLGQSSSEAYDAAVRDMAQTAVSNGHQDAEAVVPALTSVATSLRKRLLTELREKLVRLGMPGPTLVNAVEERFEAAANAALDAVVDDFRHRMVSPAAVTSTVGTIAAGAGAVVQVGQGNNATTIAISFAQHNVLTLIREIEGEVSKLPPSDDKAKAEGLLSSLGTMVRQNFAKAATIAVASELSKHLVQLGLDQGPALMAAIGMV